MPPKKGKVDKKAAKTAEAAAAAAEEERRRLEEAAQAAAAARADAAIARGAPPDLEDALQDVPAKALRTARRAFTSMAQVHSGDQPTLPYAGLRSLFAAAGLPLSAEAVEECISDCAATRSLELEDHVNADEWLVLFSLSRMPVADAGPKLRLATEAGNEAQVRRLLSRGCPLAAADGNGRTALHVAAGMGKGELISAILDTAGDAADVDMPDQSGWTPLHSAAGAGHVEAVGVLLEGGADPAARTSLGRTPLHTAAANGHARCLEMVLADEDADANAADSVGWTALFLAAAAGSIECCRLLLEAGVEADATDVMGRTASVLGPDEVAAAQRLVAEAAARRGAEEEAAAAEESPGAEAELVEAD